MINKKRLKVPTGARSKDYNSKRRWIKINSLKCLDCGSIIFSRATHDFRSCACGNSFIDGGYNGAYNRLGGGNTEQITISIYTSDKEIQQDYFNIKNRFGLLKKP